MQPALLGGLVTGVLVALPFVGLVNACCCLWVVAGGVLSAYLMQQNHPFPVSAADGALVGMLAGLIGAVIASVLATPIDLKMGPIYASWIDQLMARQPDVPPMMSTVVDQMRHPSFSIIRFIGSLMFRVVVYVIFAMLGGLLGVAMFKRDAPPPGTVDIVPPTA